MHIVQGTTLLDVQLDERPDPPHEVRIRAEGQWVAPGSGQRVGHCRSIGVGQGEGPFG